MYIHDEEMGSFDSHFFDMSKITISSQYYY